MSSPFYFDSTIWGPSFWLYLHTTTLIYPENPNDISKHKYYTMIYNLPLSIPDDKMASDFSTLLDENPITPYLDSRDSLIRWMVHIHNQINKKLNKPQLSFNDFWNIYYEKYKPRSEIKQKNALYDKKMIYTIVILGLVCTSVYLVNK